MQSPKHETRSALLGMAADVFMLAGKFRFFESDYYEAKPDSEFTAALGWNF